MWLKASVPACPTLVKMEENSAVFHWLLKSGITNLVCVYDSHQHTQAMDVCNTCSHPYLCCHKLWLTPGRFQRGMFLWVMAGGVSQYNNSSQDCISLQTSQRSDWLGFRVWPRKMVHSEGQKGCPQGWNEACRVFECSWLLSPRISLKHKGSTPRN